MPSISNSISHVSATFEGKPIEGKVQFNVGYGPSLTLATVTQAHGKHVNTTEFLIESITHALEVVHFVWSRDPIEVTGVPYPRAPWAKLALGSRWVPTLIIDNVGRWNPDGSEATLDPASTLLVHGIM